MNYGLVGEKLGHSFSAEIHRALGNEDYILKELSSAEFKDFMWRRDFKGVNITIPYKKLALEMCDVPDERARRIGAANTIVNKEGKLYAYNTDYDGLVYLLRTNGVELRKKNVLILGGGGSSATARVVAQDEGAGGIHVASRTVGEGLISYDDAKKLTDVQVVINTTPVGMSPKAEASPIDLSVFSKLTAVVDIIYNPLCTRLLLQARTMGVKYVNGLGMLVAQAKAAAEHFFSRKISNSAISQIHRAIYERRVNIVLIGMPGSGKSSLGKQLARQTGRQFVDADVYLEEKQAQSIPDIFASQGEAAFRDMESRTLSELSTRMGYVIATGGGAVLREQNVDALRSGGLLFYLSCTPQQLVLNTARPVAANIEHLQKLYEQRSEIYTRSADIIVARQEKFEDNLDNLKSSVATLINSRFL